MDLAATLTEFGKAGVETLALAAWFFALAWVVKRERAIADAKAAAGETRINLIVSVADMLAVAPVVGWITGKLGDAIHRHELLLPTAPLWSAIGPIATGVIAVFVADLAGYWRHRLQHMPWLWPAHAMHHSDTRLTWFSLGRLHPVDRLGTILDILVMAALGFPVWSISVAVLVRHYYGHFVHADLPWTFGKANLLFNPPTAHRWHHARDVEGAGANFATVFSVFDRAFGTWRHPGPCDAPLGVREDMGKGALGQYLHPFKAWGRAIAAQIRSRSHATSGASAGGIG